MAGFQFNPDDYVGLPPVQSAAPSSGRGLIPAAIETGLNEAAAQLGSGIRGVGDLIGSQGISSFGQRAEQASAAAAAQTARPDLEGSPFQGGIGHVVPWAIYNVLKGAPQFATIAAGAAAAPEVAAGRIIGGALAASPFSFGQAYQATEQTPGGQGNATSALMMTPALATLQSWLPGHAEGIIARAAETGGIKGLVKSGLVTGAVQAPVAGAMTAITDLANPDLTTKQRVDNIVDAAVGGGVMGGVIGAGAAGIGGLRAMRRVPADQVSTEDLGSVVDNFLQLPKPEGQPGGPQMGSGPTMFGDASGRVSPSQSDIVATPRDTGMSPTDRMVADATIPQAPPAIDSSTIIQDKQGSLRHAKPYEQDDTSRPFRNSTDEELAMAQRVLDAKSQNGPLIDQHQQIADLIQSELEHRAANQALTTPDAQQGVGAVERTGDDKSGVADQVSAAPAPANQNIDDLLKGISTRKSYIDAKDADEVKARLLERLQNGSTAKGDLALADRLGVDTNAPGKAVETEAQGVSKQDDKAALATDKGATTEPAAPANAEGGDRSVDADFQKQWAEDLSKKQGLALKDLKDNPPANEEDARQRIYDALGKNTPGEDEVSNRGKDTDGYNAVVDLAKQYGILDKDGAYTEEGLNIAKGRLSIEDTTAEAQKRGLNGTETSLFDSGARGITQDKFNSIEEFKAYQDGKQWGEDQRNGADLHPGATDAQTKEVQGTLRDTRPTEDITRMQFLNQAIDQVYGSTMRPQDQAQLKRMVREGATGEEVDAAAKQMRDVANNPGDERRYYQTGHGALAGAAPTNPELFKGETVTRGAPRNPEKLAQIRKEGLRNAESVAAEGDRTASSERAIAQHEERKQLLRDEVHAATLSGDITPKDRLRLLHMVNKNRLQDVIDRLPGGKLHGADQVSTSGFLNRLGEMAVPDHEPAPMDRSVASTMLRRKLVVGDARGALDEIGKNSSSPLNRLIANKLNGDWVKDVDLRHESYDESRKPINSTGIEDAVPIGRTMFDENGKSIISLYGEHGLNEETFLHEMIHALVHRRWMGDPGNDPLAARITDLHDQIVNAIEKAYPELTNNAIWADQVTSSPDEMITWAMTNHEAQEALKRIDINGNKIDAGKPNSLWNQFKGLVADLLGLPTNGRVMSALDHILQAGHAVLDQKEQIKAAANVPVPQINDRLTAAVKLKADEGASKLREILDSVSDKVLPYLLHTQSASHLAEHYGMRNRLIPELPEWHRIGQQEDAIPNIYTRIQRIAFDGFTKLQHNDPKAAERVNNIMAAPIRGVNPDLAWKDHTWLHKDPQAGILKSYVDSVRRDAQALKAKGQLGVYHDQRDSLHAQNLTSMTLLLHLAVSEDPALAHISDKLGDPLTKFMKLTDQQTPREAVKYWSNTLHDTMSTIEKQFTSMINDPNLSEEERSRLSRAVNPVQDVIKDIRGKLAVTQRVPYMHAYREGEHRVSATLRTLADGRADPAAATAVSKALGKLGFDDLTIAPELSNPSIYLSVDNKSQRSVLEKAFEKLVKQGHVQEGTVMTGKEARLTGVSPASRTALEHVIAQVEANPLFSTEGKTQAEKDVIEKQKAAIKGSLTEAWLNSLSDSSGSRVLANRKTVQGFSKDMVKSTNFRFGVGAQAIGRAWARPRLNNIISQMEARARSSRNTEDPQHAQVDKIRAIVNNVRQRDIAGVVTARHDWTDSMRTWSNIFHIGGSPAMVLVDGSQLGVMVVPHLGARHGYSATLTAMARAAPIALKVVREALAEGWKAGGAARAADISVTHNVLQRAIPDRATREFIEHMIGGGHIDISSATYAMTNDSGIGSNPKTGRLLRMAAALPQTTEIMSRMITALAARELHAKSGLSGTPEDYAARTIDDTLGHYGSSSVPPLMSKKGPAGRLGPMMLQFKLFDMNLMWKLYREFHMAFLNKAADEAERSEARSFLMGHAVMVTAIAGSLGLPYAAAAAGAVEKLKDEFFPSEHPFNAVAEYRNFLANIFGKDTAEVIAKGVPQTIGFDLSNRVGEGDLLPLTQFLTDRQNWSDTLQQWQADAIGAPASMIADQMRGLDQLHNGNVMGGLSTMMPSAIRNPMRAYQMTERGYVDGNGIPLPIESPGAEAILYQLLGLTPSAKAEYNDQREIQISTRQALTRTSNSLKMQLMRSLMTGDQDSARTALTRAQQFDAANPTYAVLPRLEQELRQRQQGFAEAQQMGTPLGVNPKDLYARSLNDYANR